VSSVKDFESALFYVFGGAAGDAGRPLSLLSFALQKDSWPGAPADFFRVNTLIHLFNGVLVFCLSYLIAQNWGKRITHPAWYALAIAALWLSLPLHVTANLAAVQRMTTLASLFMLLGLLGFAWVCVGQSQIKYYPYACVCLDERVTGDGDGACGVKQRKWRIVALVCAGAGGVFIICSCTCARSAF
jgi:hypothetical protein